MTKLVPTDEQELAIRATSETTDSLMIDALAGCAKTSTLEMLGRRVKGPALALAFNKSIASELTKRFAENFKVQTMNGFGYGALLRGRPGVLKWTLDAKKVGKLVSDEAKRRKTDISSDDWDTVRRLVTAAQTAGLVPASLDGLVPDTPECWAELMDELLLPFDAELIDMARSVLIENNRLTETGVISFDDQIYYPTLFGLAFPQFPTMLVDEAQDLSTLQHTMLARALRPDGRLVVCGDPRQAIYAFRGAHSHSMSEMLMLRPRWKPLKLSLTFRCPKVVVERQQRHAPGFRAWHLNAEGVAARLSANGDEQWSGWSYADIVRALPAPRASVAILCRNNGPLLSLAFKLLRSGIGVVMAGRDIGKGLSALAKRMGDDDVGIVAFTSKLTDWFESETSLARANGHEEKIAGITDRVECLRAVASGASCKSIGEVRKQLDKLFAREDGQVLLSSIHRSKGLEFDLVLHLDPWRVPSKQARKRALEGDDASLRQEWNLRYVCETRTKHTLIEANLEDYNGTD